MSGPVVDQASSPVRPSTDASSADGDATLAERYLARVLGRPVDAEVRAGARRALRRAVVALGAEASPPSELSVAQTEALRREAGRLQRGRRPSRRRLLLLLGLVAAVGVALLASAVGPPWSEGSAGTAPAQQRAGRARPPTSSRPAAPGTGTLPPTGSRIPGSVPSTAVPSASSTPPSTASSSPVPLPSGSPSTDVGGKDTGPGAAATVALEAGPLAPTASGFEWALRVASAERTPSQVAFEVVVPEGTGATVTIRGLTRCMPAWPSTRVLRTTCSLVAGPSGPVLRLVLAIDHPVPGTIEVTAGAEGAPGGGAVVGVGRSWEVGPGPP